MRLEIDFERRNSFGSSIARPVIKTEHGDRLPGIREMVVDSRYGSLPIATVVFVVDGDRVSIGKRYKKQIGYFDCIGNMK